MKRQVLLIMITILPFLAVAQNDVRSINRRQIKDSIAELSDKLSGKWKLEGYYYAGKYIPKVREYVNISKDTTITIYQTKMGLVEYTEINGELVKEELKDYCEVTEMMFEINGKGDYQHYNFPLDDDYFDEEDVILMSIKYMYEHFFIYYGMHYGESMELIEYVDDYQLVVVNQDNERIKYIKLKQ